jgi:hypothetical protein
MVKDAISQKDLIENTEILLNQIDKVKIQAFNFTITKE